MTYRNHFSQAIGLTIAALLVPVAPPALAKETGNVWIKDELSVDGAVRIYLNAAFTPIKGRFKAVPESIIEKKDTIEGSFLLGEYRYLFDKPEIGNDGKLSDELVSTEILDCNANYFGTMKQVRRYKGKVVSEITTPAADVTMIQTNSPNIGLKLCALSANRNVPGLEPKANPAYKPAPMPKDIDRIIDKYDIKAKK